MSSHQKFQKLALRLIKKHGRTISIMHEGESLRDEEKPWLGNDHTSKDEITTKGVFVEPNESFFRLPQWCRGNFIGNRHRIIR